MNEAVRKVLKWLHLGEHAETDLGQFLGDSPH